MSRARGEPGTGGRSPRVEAVRKRVVAAGEKVAPAQGDVRAGKRGWSSLKTRVVTAAVFSLSTVALILISMVTTVVAVAVLSGLCAFEFYTMLRADAKLPNVLVGTVTAALYPVTYAVWQFNGVLSLTTAFAVVLLVWYVFDTHSRVTDIAITLFGALYTGLMLTSLVIIREIVPGFWGGALVFAILLSVWANDALAFFVGSRFGRHKMAQHISPKKSWEGFWAGMVASVAIWCLIPLIPGMSLHYAWAVVGGIACGWIGILGDLVESRIKRGTGHKDSGNLLPGHGGFLDRCDSLILVAAMASLILRFSGIF
ncbi:MAG: phosphatidate cytidylyltransferase [Coriobacteriales bacterium]|jgi:phosphatidate cytidylyltransferase|nr:phosphatidate cytidylyltransferase [Coriobacteriales bacterium]